MSHHCHFIPALEEGRYVQQFDSEEPRLLPVKPAETNPATESEMLQEQEINSSNSTCLMTLIKFVQISRYISIARKKTSICLQEIKWIKISPNNARKLTKICIGDIVVDSLFLEIFYEKKGSVCFF